ncbi:MAG: linear amide C-N hydrolase [Reyranella sp.]|nr:linear amide C-N hydrolase [Reyranella sp.]
MRLLRFVVLVLAALMPLAQLQEAAQACLRVMWKRDLQGVFAGRSMDWDQIIDPRLVVYPRGLAVQGGVDNAATWMSRFGSVVVLGANYDGAAVDGMNEQGLTVHLLYLGATRVHVPGHPHGSHALSTNPTAADVARPIRPCGSPAPSSPTGSTISPWPRTPA